MLERQLVTMRRALTLLAVLTACLVAAAPSQAHAATPPPMDVSVPMYPVANLHVKPRGFVLDAGQALALAKTSPAMIAIHRREHPLQVIVELMIGVHWEVYFFHHGAPVGDVIISPHGQVVATYTGPLISALYARGHYGDVFDSPWVWGTLALLFLLPLALLRGDRRSVWLARFDIALLLTFGVSYALFDAAHLEPAVWTAYPTLLILLGRLLARGLSRRAPSRITLAGPLAPLAAGLVLLAAGRVALALAAPHVMDVGGASAIGAYRVLHGQSLYFASVNHPDTYGPFAYLAYVPFQLIWPGANWLTYLPSVRAATVTFDLLTILGLVVLGQRVRAGRDGLRIGLMLGWLWAACPFTALGLVKNTNDGLLALLSVGVLLAMRAPATRGALVGLAAAAKFFPAILLPLVLIGPRRGRDVRRGAAGFVVAVGALVAVFLPPGGLAVMWQHTIGFQLTRADVFSPWALHPGLAPLKILLEVAGAALALGVAWRPRGERSLAQISALAGALVIAAQLPALHWFYLYIVWFVPFLLVAVLVGSEVGTTWRPTAIADAAEGDWADTFARDDAEAVTTPPARNRSVTFEVV